MTKANPKSAAGSKRTARKAKPSQANVPSTAPEPYRVTPKDEEAVRKYHDREGARSNPARVKILERAGETVFVSLAPANGETVALARLTETFGGVDYEIADRLLSNLLNGTRIKGGAV